MLIDYCQLLVIVLDTNQELKFQDTEVITEYLMSLMEDVIGREG